MKKEKANELASKFITNDELIKDGRMPQYMIDKLPSLTLKEHKYLSIMWPKYGVLFLTSKPGVAKSAIGKSIANKMGFKYIDLRLSMMDETDMGLYPCLSEVEVDDENGVEKKYIKCLDFAVPRWAVDSNKQPTIIHFEELNRASQQVRNAALQILLERCIGMDFIFNDNVLMMSSGNLGDEDGTDVEEFDAALNNRLIHVDHSLGVEDWIKDFANKECHSTIVSFIRAYPEHLYKNSDNKKAYSTPRSWTMISKFITMNFGMNATPREFLPSLREVAHGYVGGSAMKYLQYCQDMINITIQDVLNRYDAIKNDLAKYNRDKNSELIQSLKEIDLTTLKKAQFDNLAKFLDTVSDDEKTGYLIHILDNTPEIQEPMLKEFIVHFRGLLSSIKKINDPDGEYDKDKTGSTSKSK